MDRRERGSLWGTESKVSCLVLVALALIAIPNVVRAVRTERTRSCVVAVAQAARTGAGTAACPVTRQPLAARTVDGLATVACPDTSGHLYRTPARAVTRGGKRSFVHDLPPSPLEPGQSIPISTGWAEHATVSRDEDGTSVEIEKTLLVRWVLGPTALAAVAIATIALAEEWWARKRGARRAGAILLLVALNPLVVLPIAWMGASERIDVDEQGHGLWIHRRSFGVELVRPARLENVLGLALVGSEECRVLALVERDDRCEARVLFAVAGREQDLRGLSALQRALVPTD